MRPLQRSVLRKNGNELGKGYICIDIYIETQFIKCLGMFFKVGSVN